MRDWVVHVVKQSFFRRARILRRSPPPTASPSELSRQPVFAAQLNDRVRTLTGRLDMFNQLVDADTPLGLGAVNTATMYVHMADWWTTESEHGELIIEDFDDIPFLPDMGAVEEVLVDDLRDMLGSHITAPAMQLGGDGWLLTKWLVASGALIRRELTVDSKAHVGRSDTVYDSELPVPLGRFWGADETGRLVPTG